MHIVGYDEPVLSRCSGVSQLGNPRPTFFPTQVGLGITQTFHCEVTHVSLCTVQCIISTSILVNLANLGISPPYCTKSIYLLLQEIIQLTIFFLSVRFRMMTVPSINNRRSWDCLREFVSFYARLSVCVCVYVSCCRRAFSA